MWLTVGVKLTFTVEVEAVKQSPLTAQRELVVEAVEAALYDPLGPVLYVWAGYDHPVPFRVDSWRVHYVPRTRPTDPPLPVRHLLGRDLSATPDADGLDDCQRLIEQVEEAKTRAVVAMRQSSPLATWDDIARFSGMSCRQAAQKKWGAAVKTAQTEAGPVDDDP